MGSNIRFGIASDLSGLSQGIIVNSIQKNNNTESAQARDQLGNIMDIATYSDDKQVTIDGLYISDGIKPGTIISVNNQNYMVTTTGREELNTAFQTATINARLFPGDEPPTPPGPIIPNPSLSFKSVQNDGAVIQLNQYQSPSAVQLVYSKNNGPWTTYNIGDIINLNQGDIVFLSGANDHFSKDSNNFYYFTIAGQVEVSGNIMSLMNFSDSCTNYCFFRLFSDCDDLLTAPQLPATTLANRCYREMFFICTSLTTPPSVLPATELVEGCYMEMFRNCSSLSTAPTLPASTLADWCYSYMFQSCTALTAAPTLPASTLADECYQNMFQFCSSLKTAPQLPATELAPSCYLNMFYNCTKLSTAPDLPASTLFDSCYSSMFHGCTSLTSAPALPASTLAPSCYSYMFQFCSSLSTAPTLPAITLVEGCYNYMFNGCSNLVVINVNFASWDLYNSTTYYWVDGVGLDGTFYKPQVLGPDWGVSRIPAHGPDHMWTVITKD